MLNEKELKDLDILDWSRLAKDFKEPDLLLGNGFSLNITDRFYYNSLFEKFLEKCKPEFGSIYKSFKTSSFEFILEKLQDADDTNEIFGVKIYRVKEAIEDLKTGLVSAIQDNHPKAVDINKNQLESIANHLKGFNDVFSLNYDLFLYLTIMILNEKSSKDKSIQPYSDYFYGEYIYDRQFTSFTDEKCQGYDKFVYYLHGALFLFKESFYDLKLRKAGDSTELIKLIGKAIQKEMMPLFVNEGTPEQKQAAINRSSYLRFALENLQTTSNPLVIFGTSLSDSDKHIIDAINKNKRDLAISIHVGHRTKEEIESEMHLIKSKLTNPKVQFFNSATLFKF